MNTISTVPTPFPIFMRVLTPFSRPVKGVTGKSNGRCGRPHDDDARPCGETLAWKV